MNYQLEPQTLQAVSILTDAKKRKDDAGFKSVVWEFTSATPLTMIDHIDGKTMTLETEVVCKKIRQTIFCERLKLPGYEAVMSYVISIMKRTKQ